MLKILIAEDEEPIANLIRMHLGFGWGESGGFHGPGKV